MKCRVVCGDNNTKLEPEVLFKLEVDGFADVCLRVSTDGGSSWRTPIYFHPSTGTFKRVPNASLSQYGFLLDNECKVKVEC